MEIEARGAEWRAIYVGEKKKRSKELGRRALEGKRERRERERGVVAGSLFYTSC